MGAVELDVGAAAGRGRSDAGETLRIAPELYRSATAMAPPAIRFMESTVRRSVSVANVFMRRNSPSRRTLSRDQTGKTSR